MVSHIHTILIVCVCAQNEMRFQALSSAQKFIIVFDDLCVCEQVHLALLSICLRSLKNEDK